MISVIIPLYNKEAIIEKSLLSVISQDYDDFEVVIVNDGSTDRSADIVRSIKDSRIRLIEQENCGPSKARNTGMQNAKGEWIVFLDADDELFPEVLKRFAIAIEVYKDADLIACPFYIDNTKERILQFPYKEECVNNPFKSCFFRHFLPRTGAFVCRKEILQNTGFNESIRRFEDLGLLYRLYGNAKIYTISEPSMVVNQEYAAASHGRKDIKEDFVGHLDFKGKSFWEKMCLYQLFIWERPNYSEQCRKLYPSLYKRFDLYLAYQFLIRTRKLWI